MPQPRACSQTNHFSFFSLGFRTHLLSSTATLTLFFPASAQVITVPQSKELIAATKNKGIKGDDDQADEDDDDDD